MEELNKLKLITEVYNYNKNCTKCNLCKTRKNFVLSEGNVNSKIMFIGEGPGKDEDEQARPFVGRSGKLLTEYIEKYLGFDRKHFYITNMVKCRPINGNKDRVPTQFEIDSCCHILKNEIDIIKPYVIITLGNTSTKFFLKNIRQGITSIHGKAFNINDTIIFPIYHPSYVIRNIWDKNILKEYETDFIFIKNYFINQIKQV
jgi:uracil-DNA glycosylase family 4